MAARFEIKGAEAMKKRLRQIKAEMRDQVADALRLEAEQVMTHSKRDFVPVDLGNLRSSGFVQPVEREGRDLKVVLSYGGAAAPYALAIHENPSEHDPPSWKGVVLMFKPAGRGQKYLEKPLNEAVDGMADRIGKKLL